MFDFKKNMMIVLVACGLLWGQNVNAAQTTVKYDGTFVALQTGSSNQKNQVIGNKNVPLVQRDANGESITTLLMAYKILLRDNEKPVANNAEMRPLQISLPVCTWNQVDNQWSQVDNMWASGVINVSQDLINQTPAYLSSFDCELLTENQLKFLSDLSNNKKERVLTKKEEELLRAISPVVKNHERLRNIAVGVRPTEQEKGTLAWKSAGDGIKNLYENLPIIASILSFLECYNLGSFGETSVLSLGKGVLCAWEYKDFRYGFISLAQDGLFRRAVSLSVVGWWMVNSIYDTSWFNLKNLNFVGFAGILANFIIFLRASFKARDNYYKNYPQVTTKKLSEFTAKI